MQTSPLWDGSLQREVEGNMLVEGSVAVIRPRVFFGSIWPLRSCAKSVVCKGSGFASACTVYSFRIRPQMSSAKRTPPCLPTFL